MVGTLVGKRVAILATDGFEEEELASPREALLERGAKVDVISPKSGSIRGWHHGNWGGSVDVDVALADARPDSYDALVLPGGVINPDKLRLVPEAIAFITAFARTKRPIGAICHGPWLLIDARLAGGKRVASWPSLRRDLENAGARWIDAEVVVDGNLVTSREPGDLPAFEDMLAAMLESQPDRRVEARP
jgi:protease I